MDSTPIVNLVTIGLNLIVLGLNLKLYTEYFKDRSQSKRKETIKGSESEHSEM